VCGACSQERAFNAAKGKEQRICKTCVTHMLGQFQLPTESGQDETAASLLQQLEVLNTALRQERAKRISLEDEIDTFQVQNDASETFPELAAQLAEIKAQAEDFARQREDLEKRLRQEKVLRESEQHKLEKAQSKLKVIKEKLGQALCGLTPGQLAQ